MKFSPCLTLLSSRGRFVAGAPDLSSSPFLEGGVPLTVPSLCIPGLLDPATGGLSAGVGWAGVAIAGVAPIAAGFVIPSPGKHNQNQDPGGATVESPL